MRSGIVKVGAAALFGVGASAIHYSYLKYKRSNNHIATGTDSISSGDLIFFRRSPYNYPISVGLSIHLYQKAHDSTVDHCGLIVEDNIGRPFIYELTPTGPALTPFVKRISESLSDYIVLVPLRKSGADEITFRKNLFQYALNQKKNNNSGSEALELYKASLVDVLAKPEDVAMSPSVNFVLKALIEAGLEFQEENRNKILCDDFMSGKYQPIVQEGKGRFRYGESLVIRSC